MPAISAVLDLKGLGYRQLYMPAVFHLTGLITLVERNYPYVGGRSGNSEPRGLPRWCTRPFQIAVCWEALAGSASASCV